MDAQSILCRNIMDEISSSLAKNFKSTDINQFSKDCSEKGIGDKVGLSAQLHKVTNTLAIIYSTGHVSSRVRVDGEGLRGEGRGGGGKGIR